MAGSLWYKPQTTAQSIYYTLRNLADSTFRLRPDLMDVFQGEFVYPLELIRNTIPFIILSPSSNVLHIGFDRTYFDKGMSHPLIEAAIVGKEGMVRCVDPNQHNIDALNSYAREHDIPQLMAVQGAAWNRNEDLEFAFDGHWGPMSGTVSIPEQSEYASQQAENQLKTVRAKQIDKLVPEIFGDRQLDYLALTINGAEPQALEGAKQTLENNPNLRISMALAYNHFSFELRKQVCNQMISEGWNVVVSNSPHDPWRPNVFLWSCMVRESNEFIKKLGARPATWEQVAHLAQIESMLIQKRVDQIRLHLKNHNISTQTQVDTGRQNKLTGFLKRNLMKFKRILNKIIS